MKLRRVQRAADRLHPAAGRVQWLMGVTIALMDFLVF